MSYTINLDHRNFAIIDAENCRSQLRFLSNYLDCFEKIYIAYSDYYITSAINYEISNLRINHSMKEIKEKVILDYINAERKSAGKVGYFSRKNLADVALMLWTFQLVENFKNEDKKPHSDYPELDEKSKPINIFILSEDNAFKVFSYLLSLKFPFINKIKIFNGNTNFLLKENDKYYYINKDKLSYNPLTELSTTEIIISLKRKKDGYTHTRKYKNLERVNIKTLIKGKIIPFYVDRLNLEDTVVLDNEEHEILKIESKKIKK